MPYLSDPSDEQWALIEPVITAWKQRHRSVSGHRGRYAMHEIINAILYQARTGCQWRYLPHDLPPYTAVYGYFAAWRDDGTDQTVHGLLRCQVRERAGREEDPSRWYWAPRPCGPRSAHRRTRPGWTPGNKDRGHKRGLAVDVLDLVITVVVAAASVHGLVCSSPAAGVAAQRRLRR